MKQLSTGKKFKTINFYVKSKSKVFIQAQVADGAGAWFRMKRLGVLLLLPGWNASPSQGYPRHICWYPFVHLGEEKHCESKVSCLRTQHNDPGQVSNLDHSI